jgi:hypothetical protein
MTNKKINLSKVNKFCIILLLFLLQTQTLLICESEQKSLEAQVKDALRSNLEYIGQQVDEEGVAVGYGDASIKATARLGIIAGYIHLGIRDDESLKLLNKIAKALNKLSSNIDNQIIDKNERILIEQSLIEFSLIYYGLTSSTDAKNILLKSCRYFVDNFGWNPVTACSTYLLYSAHVSYISGGRISRVDIEDSLKEIKERHIEFVNYTAWGGRNLAYGLNILSTGLKIASILNVNPPVEFVALWEVHLNYSIQYLKHVREPSIEESEIFLDALVSALEVPYPTKLRGEAIDVSEDLAGKLLEDWMAGGRMILQSRSSINYLIYNPALNYSEILTLFNKFPKVKVYDLDLPIILDRLSRIEGVKNVEMYMEASSTAVSIVLSSKPYFKVIDEEIMPKQYIVDNIISTRFLSSWYALQKIKTAPPSQITIIMFSGSSYITLTFCSIFLLTLLFLHRIGKLIKEE